MYIPRLDNSCRYDVVGVMVYRWKVPGDVDSKRPFRMKLTTAHPVTKNVSGRFQISNTTSSAFSVKQTDKDLSVDLSSGGMPLVFIALAALLLLTFCSFLRLHRKSNRIALP